MTNESRRRLEGGSSDMMEGKRDKSLLWYLFAFLNGWTS